MNYFHIEKYLPDEVLEYLRKSRADDPLETVEEVVAKHERILNEWVERNMDDPIPEENVYREVVSGETIEGRPEMQKLLKRIEDPRIKAVLVVEPQRLSRGDLEDCGRLIKLLRYTNTKVITPMRTYDLSYEDDRESFERKLKQGNDYLEYFKKIQKRGTDASVASGNFVGSVAPYGYDKVTIMDGRKKCPTLAPNEKEAPVVQMIFDMYVNQGMGLVNIGRKLDAMGIKPRKSKSWSYPALLDLVQNVHYIGKIKWNWRKQVHVVKDQELSVIRPKQKDFLIFEGKHDPLISEELFYQAQELRKKSSREAPDQELKNPFAGLLYCKCGRALQHRAYRMKSGKYSEPRFQCFNQAVCGCGSVLAVEMMDAIKDYIKNQIQEFEVLMTQNDSAALKQKEQTVVLLEKKLKDLEAKEISLWEKYAEEGMPKSIFENLKEKVEADKQSVIQSLEEERGKVITFADYTEKIATFSKALYAMDDDTLPAKEKNRFLKECIEVVTYHRERPQRTGGKGKAHGWQSPPIELNIQLKL